MNKSDLDQKANTESEVAAQNIKDVRAELEKDSSNTEVEEANRTTSQDEGLLPDSTSKNEEADSSDVEIDFAQLEKRINAQIAACLKVNNFEEAERLRKFLKQQRSDHTENINRLKDATLCRGIATVSSVGGISIILLSINNASWALTLPGFLMVGISLAAINEKFAKLFFKWLSTIKWNEIFKSKS